MRRRAVSTMMHDGRGLVSCSEDERTSSITQDQTTVAVETRQG